MVTLLGGLFTKLRKSAYVSLGPAGTIMSFAGPVAFLLIYLRPSASFSSMSRYSKYASVLAERRNISSPVAPVIVFVVPLVVPFVRLSSSVVPSVASHTQYSL